MTEIEAGYTFEIDDEIDAFGDLEGRLAAIIEADEARAMWGLGRAYQRLMRAQAVMRREQQAIFTEYERRDDELVRRAKIIGGYIEEIVRMKRARGDGNAVDLPGIGRWSTRTVAAGWDVTNTAEADHALVAFLRESYEAEAAAIIEDRPHIKRDMLRAWLDSLNDETVVPVIEGLGQYIARRAERISVSFKEG